MDILQNALEITMEAMTGSVDGVINWGSLLEEPMRTYYEEMRTSGDCKQVTAKAIMGKSLAVLGGTKGKVEDETAERSTLIFLYADALAKKYGAVLPKVMRPVAEEGVHALVDFWVFKELIPAIDAEVQPSEEELAAKVASRVAEVLTSFHESTVAMDQLKMILEKDVVVLVIAKRKEGRQEDVNLARVANETMSEELKAKIQQSNASFGGTSQTKKKPIRKRKF